MPAPVINAVKTVYTDLPLLTGMSTYDQAEVSGYYAPADGGGGLFYYDSTSSVAADGGAVIAPNSPTPGRWLRVMAGQGGNPGGPASAVSVKWWGAKGNGDSSSAVATANVTAFQAAINYAYALETSFVPPCAVYIPSGSYWLNGTVTVKGDAGSAVALLGDGPNLSQLFAKAPVSGSYTRRAEKGSGFTFLPDIWVRGCDAFRAISSA